MTSLKPDTRHLLVGLGNPGNRYVRTRHNIGWRIVEAYATKHGVDSWKNDQTARALVARHDQLILAKPQTMMNASGQAVRRLTDHYQVAPAATLIVTDDYHLPFGQLRYRAKGSAGGHQGLDSIIAALGTSDLPRLRVGIGQPSGSGTEHVLGTFTKAEERTLPEVVALAVASLEEHLHE